MSRKVYVYVVLVVMFCMFMNKIRVYGMDAGDYYRERLEFDEEGNLHMTSHDKKATSDIRYQTVGWTIKRYDMPIDAPGQECAFIKLYSRQDIAYRDDPIAPGYTYCYYIGDKDEIIQAISRRSEAWMHQLKQYGGTVYLDAILSIREYGVECGGLIDSFGNRWGEVYDTYAGISEARPWASKESLKTHFNKSAFYPPKVREKKYEYEEKSVFSSVKKHEAGGSMKIGSHLPGKELYDVVQGIPTGQTLYVSGEAEAWTYQIAYQKVRIKLWIPIEVKTNYILTWNNYEGHEVRETTEVSRWYRVYREVEYWMVHDIKYYYLTSVLMENYAFSNEKIAIRQSGWMPEIVKKQYQNYYEHIKIPAYESQVWTKPVKINGTAGNGIRPSIPDDDFSEFAKKKIGTIQVRNDALEIENTEILNDSWCIKCETPKQQKVHKKALIYKEGYKIPHAKMNQLHNMTTVTLKYQEVSSGAVKKVNVMGCNPVSIHTPVCATLQGNIDKTGNQLVTPDDREVVFLVDGMGTFNVGTVGLHKNLLGYGMRDYKEFTEKSMLKIPFDVILEGKTIKKDTWFRVEAGEVQLLIPEDVAEGYYTIQLKNYAKNYRSQDGAENQTQVGANTRIENYVAMESLRIHVVGRLYGLSVGNKHYRVGSRDREGKETGHKNIFPYRKMQWKGTSIPYSVDYLGTVTKKSDLKVEIHTDYIDNTGKRIPVRLYQKEEDEDKFKQWSGDQILRLDQCSQVKNEKLYPLPAEVEQGEEVSSGLHRWSGRIEFKEQVCAVPEQTELKGTVSEAELQEHILEGGNILLSFHIWSRTNRQLYLTYLNTENLDKGYCSMWKTEGYQKRWDLGENIRISTTLGDALLLNVRKKIEKKVEFYVTGTH